MKTSILENLIIFSEVVEKQSFSGAAKALSLSKATVSKRISKLESDLNARLLNRSTRRIALTEAGQSLYQHCIRISDELDSAEKSVTHLQTNPAGILKIHSPSSFGHLHLVPAIADFMRQYPDIQVQISFGGNMTNLIDNGYDMAIMIGTPSDSNLIARLLAKRGMFVCASKTYFEQHGRPERPEQLIEHNCLVYNEWPHQETWRFIDEGGKELFVKIQGTFHAGSSDALREAALSHLGVTMLPGFMLTRHIKNGQLECVLETFTPKDIGIYALYPHRRQLATKVRIFIDFLIDRFQPESYWRST